MSQAEYGPYHFRLEVGRKKSTASISIRGFSLDQIQSQIDNWSDKGLINPARKKYLESLCDMIELGIEENHPNFSKKEIQRILAEQMGLLPVQPEPRRLFTARGDK